MILDDFFTLAEMTSGLTTLARVEELICAMQAQKSRATSNVGDAARQWSTVASTLASTENQDCLTHFVYLNGLCFLNQWLQEAVKYNQDAIDAEELINVLLGSLEKLPVDGKKLIDSGILLTVEKLLGHKTADLKLRAQTLFERWNAERINEDGRQDPEKGCLNLVESSKPSDDATSVEDKKDCDQKFESPTCRTATEDGLPHQTMKVNSLFPTLDSRLYEEKLSVGESSASPVGMAPSSAPVSPKVLIKDDDECATSSTKNHGDIDAEVNAGLGVPYDSGQRESFCVLSPAKKPLLVHSTSATLESINGKFDMSEPMDGDPRSASADQGRSKHSRTALAEIRSEEEFDEAVRNLFGNGILLRKEPAEFATEDNQLLNQPIPNESEEADELRFGNPSKISKCRATDESKRRSGLDLESGEFDALEVARQVAIEVEREVVDYREQSCSSSADASSRYNVGTAIPDTAQNKQDHTASRKPIENGSVSRKDDSDAASSPKNFNCKFPETSADLRNMTQRLDSPNQAADYQRTSKKIKRDFDLNVKVFSENSDCAMNTFPSNYVNLSAPAVASVSNGASTIIPLHFEAELGWRGSTAAANAFHPASLRMAPDSEMADTVLKPKENLMEIDLNVADGENDVAADPAVLNDFLSYGIPSRDSSIEVSSGRAARIQFDLNSMGDGEAPSLQSSILSYHPQKRSRSPSPTPSPSRKLSMRNFDLNDNPFGLDVCGSQNINVTNSSTFTIMGTKMSVERTDGANQAHPAYMGSGLAWDGFTGGESFMHVHQPPSPGYGYNGLGIAPDFPFATVMPHLMCSSGVYGAPLSCHPFLTSMADAPSSSNGVEPSHLGLNLNSGALQMEEGGNREAGRTTHYFMPGCSNLLEEQMKSASQHATSGLPLKRKEPDSGWDPYGFGYSQLMSWL